MKKICLIVGFICLVMLSSSFMVVSAQSADEQYAFINYAEDQPYLYLFDMTSKYLSEKTFPLQFQSGEHLQGAFVSPQGDWLLLQITEPENRWRLWRLSDNTTVDLDLHRAVIERPDNMRGEFQSLAWSPDELYVAFNSSVSQEEQYEILLYDLLTKTITTITPPNMSQLHLAWSDDSHFLATTSSTCINNVCSATTLEVYDVASKQFTHHITIDEFPDSPFEELTNACNLQWSPDNEAISYISRCDGTSLIVPYDIFVQSLSTSQPVSTNFLPTDIPLDQLLFIAYNDYTWLDSSSVVIGSFQLKADLVDHSSLGVYTPQTYLYHPDNNELSVLFDQNTSDWTRSKTGLFAYVSYTFPDEPVSLEATGASIKIAQYLVCHNR